MHFSIINLCIIIHFKCVFLTFGDLKLKWLSWFKVIVELYLISDRPYSKTQHMGRRQTLQIKEISYNNRNFVEVKK